MSFLIDRRGFVEVSVVHDGSDDDDDEDGCFSSSLLGINLGDLLLLLLLGLVVLSS